MKKALCLILIMLFSIMPALAQSDSDLNILGDAACQALLSGDYAMIVSTLNDAAAAQIDEALLSQTMTALAAQYDNLTGVVQAEYIDDANAAVYTLKYENGVLLLTFIFDEDDRISGLTLTPGQSTVVSERPLPEGAVETEVTLFPDSDRSLSGRIIAPADANAATPYVIFIHGSGPSDMDETIGGNRIFRDMAYDLATRGIGSLRFDKITYSHPELFTESATMDTEYLQPVQEAMNALKTHIGATHVYALGHSLGGTLTPYLVFECGFSGGIALAGTPLPLWQISYDQNLLLIETLPEAQRPALTSQVEAEREKALEIPNMTDEAAASTTIFGMNGLYLKSLVCLDAIELAQTSQKPFLFLWGQQDIQINRTAYEAWQAHLDDDGPFTYITYPNLNHMFLPAESTDSIANIQSAYSRPATVPETVSEDIARWIAQTY